ncbi:MAG TPA: hypothetical protein VK137_06235, partial [Planctomycetaceae bacterium]|nr:hypothetical protein [Planctomycetaceae bacterium]
MHSMDFFRRNLKPMMAALTLMSMISFVFMDDTMRSHSHLLVPLLFGMLAGGAAFIWGTRSGRQNEYLAMGAVVGIVFGLVVTSFGSRDGGTQQTVAGLSQRDIAQLKSRRQSANQIVTELYRQSHEVPREMLQKNPFLAQFAEMDAQQALQNLHFNFHHDLDKDVVFAHLLRQEAQRLGITVSDDAVKGFIRFVEAYPGRFVQGHKLSDADYQQIRQRLHLGDHFIFELLRDELEARMAESLTFPRNAVTPEQRWQDFRKVAVKQQIEVATIPVEPFEKGVPDPSDNELQAFFKDHAEKYPGPKGQPGFRQPTKVKLAYLEADYETIEKTITPPTDEEIAEYYDDNLESYIDRTPNKTEKKDDDLSTDEGEKKDSEKPDKPEVADKSVKPNADLDDKPKVDSDDKKPEADKQVEPEKSDKPKDDKPADASKSEAAKSDPQGAAGDDKLTAEKADGDVKDSADNAKNSADKNSEEPKPTDDPKKEDPKTDEPKADDPKKDAPAPPTDTPKPEDDAKSDDKKPEVRYKPFEDVKDSIRDQLLRERTLEE